MAIDLVTSMTFGQILLEVAERVGKADYVNDDDPTDNRARIPEDPHDLDKLKRCVNLGYKKFCNSNPRWRFLEHKEPLTIDNTGTLFNSVNADPARYRLPVGINGQAKGVWRYNDRTSPLDAIVLITDTDIDQLRQSDSESTGVPRYAAICKLKTGDNIGAQPDAWEVVFHPSPGQQYVLNCVFRISPPKLVELEQRHVCGSDHDEAIIAFSVWEWKKNDALEPSEIAIYQNEKAESLAQSIALDDAARPSNLDVLPDASPTDTLIRTKQYTERQRNGVPLV